jgi:hypothetical protein
MNEHPIFEKSAALHDEWLWRKNARSGTVGHGDMFFVLCGCLE